MKLSVQLSVSKIIHIFLRLLQLILLEYWVIGLARTHTHMDSSLLKLKL